MGNPAFIYCGVWGGVLLLYLLNATTNLVPVSGFGVVLILLNMFSMVLICFFFAARSLAITPSYDQASKYEAGAQLYFRGLIFCWFLGTLLEIFFQRGFPLYWVLVGDGRLYTDFGIPSFHGVMNAMYLQAVTVLAYLYILKPRKFILVIGVMLLFWPVLMLGRGILLSAIIQILAVFLVMRSIGLKSFSVMCFSAISAVVLFGWLGDIRQVANPFSHLVRYEYSGFFSFMPSGFLWFYVYLTSGLSNLFFNIDTLQPVYAFEHTFYNLIPSFLKNYWGIDTRKDLFMLVDSSLNASTYYAAYISDFGVLGAFFTAFFIQIFCGWAYFSAKRGMPWGVLSYAVAVQVLMFSVFYDLFFILPVLMQFILAAFFCIIYKSNRLVKR